MIEILLDHEVATFLGTAIVIGIILGILHLISE